MWNSTTKTTATSSSETNDNKEQNIEVCSCHSGGSNTDIHKSSGSVDCLHKTQQQQQLNNFETNSKSKQKLKFGGNLTKIDNSSTSTSSITGFEEGENDFNNKLQEKEAIDSGFISGPQNSSEIFYSNSQELNTEDQDLQGAVGGITKFNILPKELTQKKETATIDSGIVEADDVEGEGEGEGENETNEEGEESKIVCRNQQARLEKSSSSSSNSNSNSSQTANKNLYNNPKATNTNINEVQMFVKQNVDAGMSEWFCNLSLQSNGMNNLDTDNDRKAHTTALENQRTPHLQQQQPQLSQQLHPQPQQISFIPGLPITPSNAWEQFYRQNDEGDTPLHLAVICGRTDVVLALLRTAPHPCLLNIQNDEAQTPLHLAARTSQPAIIRMLLLAGSEPKARDRDGNTALHLACRNGDFQSARTLVEKFSASEIAQAHRQFGHLSNDKSISSLNYAKLPSDLEIRNYNGERCVHLVAQNGNIDILRLLVLHGADINAREGRSGLTPLHMAIECCNEKLANFLLDECEKLNVETATYAGLTAYQIACMLNKSQMQTMLVNYGAVPLTPPDSDYDSSDIEDFDEVSD